MPRNGRTAIPESIFTNRRRRQRKKKLHADEIIGVADFLKYSNFNFWDHFYAKYIIAMNLAWQIPSGVESVFFPQIISSMEFVSGASFFPFLFFKCEKCSGRKKNRNPISARPSSPIKIVELFLKIEVFEKWPLGFFLLPDPSLHAWRENFYPSRYENSIGEKEVFCAPKVKRRRFLYFSLSAPFLHL